MAASVAARTPIATFSVAEPQVPAGFYSALTGAPVEPPQQAHFDFDVPDLDAAQARVLSIGARKHEVQPGTSFASTSTPPATPPA